MRYVVVGAGAVGGGTAALLHEAGHDVQLVARGSTLAALRSEGLELEVGESARTVPVPTLAGLHEATRAAGGHAPWTPRRSWPGSDHRVCARAHRSRLDRPQVRSRRSAVRT